MRTQPPCSDFDAFGSLLDARPFIESIAHANRLDRDIPTGPNPAILYFTGKTRIFEADTVIGTISANHNPSHNVGGPGGVRLDNTITVSIEFREPVTFENARLDALLLIRYLGMLVGRPQNLLNLWICTQSCSGPPLNVYWCMRPKREPSHQEQKPHPGDVLLEPVRQSDRFTAVLGNWLERQRDWYDARRRFFDSFAEQNQYSIDRLVGAANMFDILPSSAVPPDIPVSKELEDARDKARTTFRALPASPERDSILNALGRIGKASLKRKIRARAQSLLDTVPDRLPELFTVTDQAVNCRNHYVHGSEASFDYDEHFDSVIFFTDTLEFVFAASDLIEAGWDARNWFSTPTGMCHPFDKLKVNYKLELQRLKTLLSK